MKEYKHYNCLNASKLHFIVEPLLFTASHHSSLPLLGLIELAHSKALTGKQKILFGKLNLEKSNNSYIIHSLCNSVMHLVQTFPNSSERSWDILTGHQVMGWQKFTRIWQTGSQSDLLDLRLWVQYHCFPSPETLSQVRRWRWEARGWWGYWQGGADHRPGAGLSQTPYIIHCTPRPLDLSGLTLGNDENNKSVMLIAL